MEANAFAAAAARSRDETRAVTRCAVDAPFSATGRASDSEVASQYAVELTM